jgi:hypothetical protein
MNICTLQSRLEEGWQNHIGIKNMELNNSCFLLSNVILKCIKDRLACAFSDVDNADYNLFLQASCIYVERIEVVVKMAINF